MIIDGGSVLFSDFVCLIYFPLRRCFRLELIQNSSSLGVVDPVQQLSDHSESLRNDATSDSRVVVDLSALDGHIKDDDSSQRRGQPEVLVIHGTGIHAEAIVWLLDKILGQVQELQEVG
jgi:hypothetical protein